MNSPRDLIIGFIAAYVPVDRSVVTDDTLLEHDLGLDALDLVFLTVRLHDAAPGLRRVPIADLANAKTVADLVSLVDRDTLDMSVADSA